VSHSAAGKVKRGVTLKKLAKWITQPVCIWCFGGLGDAVLIVGIVTAAIGLTMGGFVPIYWFLLAFAC